MKAGQVNVNTSELESIISQLSSSKATLEGDAMSSVSSDFNALTSVGLFTEGLSSIKANIQAIVDAQNSFINSFSSHLATLKQQEAENVDIVNTIGGGSRSPGGGGYRSATPESPYKDADTDDVKKGTKVSTSELATFIAEMDSSVSKTLLENLTKQAATYNTTLTELLLNPEKSGLLLEILKKLCGDDNAEIDTTSTNESNLIQKILLAKLAGYDDNAFASLSDNTILKGIKYFKQFAKENGISIVDLLYDSKYNDKLIEALQNLYDGKALITYEPTQDEINAARTYIDDIAKGNNTTAEKLLESSDNLGKIKKYTETKVIKQSAKKEEKKTTKSTTTTSTTTSPVDTSSLPKVGEHTSEWDTQGNKWTIATTAASVPSYASYVKGKISQNANTSKFGDKCLSFAETHAYALYTGKTNDSADVASQYPHSGAFTSWFSDDKKEALQKVYSEIVSGRPVVIQVNGNKQGTSRHFVTVVGFKEGTTAESITEKDLLIIDSWDGQTERMDEANSRFLTSGKDCGKTYSGYYLRILKT